MIDINVISIINKKFKIIYKLVSNYYLPKF